jgi:acyl carrier protein
MTKEIFLNTLEEVLEVDQLTETSSIELDSLQILAIIAFVDENFDKQLKTTDLENIKSVSDLTSLIGVKFE